MALLSPCRNSVYIQFAFLSTYLYSIFKHNTVEHYSHSSEIFFVMASLSLCRNAVDIKFATPSIDLYSIFKQTQRSIAVFPFLSLLALLCTHPFITVNDVSWGILFIFIFFFFFQFNVKSFFTSMTAEPAYRILMYMFLALM